MDVVKFAESPKMERHAHKTSSLHSSIHDTSSRGSIFSNFETVQVSIYKSVIPATSNTLEVRLVVYQ